MMMKLLVCVFVVVVLIAITDGGNGEWTAPSNTISPLPTSYPSDDGSTYIIDPSGEAFVYDGNGALSAGASSRLLYDYDPHIRNEILDFLFKPNFGANLHLLKVEIGGDGQSTDGTEASHMHNRDDLSCNRPYEFWLMEEARKRNPDIVTYALSWAVPYWVGNQTGYYCQDNIDYHIKWLQCAQEHNIGPINLIGNWNERSYGPEEWTIDFRRALDRAGFGDTKISLPDDKREIEAVEQSLKNDTFREAVYSVGNHYPCDAAYPQLRQVYGKKYWASEDYSTVADWAGAGCWGNALNENFVRMNITSTIAWSLIWSVYPFGEPYFGNGLMYAYEPWSGHYTVNSPIWTSAHTCQFVKQGWLMLVEGSGHLDNGGSYVSYTNQEYLTIVVSKLFGDCLRCTYSDPTPERAVFKLLSPFNTLTHMQLWSTNSTHQFEFLGNATVENGTVALNVASDTLYTLSSWYNGQQKGQPSSPIPPSTPMPLPYHDDFSGYAVDGLAKYFADDGGSFQVAKGPVNTDNQVLKQWVVADNGVNGWQPNTQPISYFGSNFTRVNVSIGVFVSNTTTYGSSRGQVGYQFVSVSNGQCLDVKGYTSAKGTTIDTYDCVDQPNEYFVYGNTTGHFSPSYNDLCMGTSPCLNSSAGVCQVDCDTGKNTSWTIWSDGSIRLASDTTHCLTATPGTMEDGRVYLSQCGSPLPETQAWSQTKSSGTYGGVCVNNGFSRATIRPGFCLYVTSGMWVFRTPTHQTSGPLQNAFNAWHHLSIGFSSAQNAYVASVDGSEVSSLPISAGDNSGQLALVSCYIAYIADNELACDGYFVIQSGYHVTYYDDFTTTQA